MGSTAPYSSTTRFLKGTWLAILLIASLACACGNDNTASPDIPQVPVYEEIFLNTVETQPLKQFPYFIYHKGGVKGLIIYYNNATNTYTAFERNCTYNPNSTCATVSVDASNLFMIDTCCSSRFDFTGTPNAGPARYLLKQYPASYIPPNRLVVRNY